MQKSTIQIEVQLDEQKIPSELRWKAENSTAADWQMAKAMLLSFWDNADKSALRVDLWTKDMMVDEMTDFFYQVLTGMAETYDRATHNSILSKEIKTFAQNFYQKFREQQAKENKL